MRSFDVTLVSTFTQKNLSQTVNTYVLCMMEINFYGPIFYYAELIQVWALPTIFLCIGIED